MGFAVHYLLLSLALIATTGCVIPFVIPPTRAEVAPITALADRGHNAGIRAAVGASWASGTTNREHSRDIAAGYVYERLSTPALDPADGPTPGARPLHGGYLEYGQVIARGAIQRIWISGRGELLYDSRAGGVAWGASARSTWELFTVGEGEQPLESNCAFGTILYSGTNAIGLYVEAGYRRLPDQGPALVATAGLSVRVPTALVIAAFFPLPGC